VNNHALSSDFLDALQRETFAYFFHEANPLNGLIADKIQAGSPASIAAVGFALSAYPIGVERGFVRRGDAIARILATLRFFHVSVQSTEVGATGYKGGLRHFACSVSLGWLLRHNLEDDEDNEIGIWSRDYRARRCVPWEPLGRLSGG